MLFLHPPCSNLIITKGAISNNVNFTQSMPSFYFCSSFDKADLQDLRIEVSRLHRVEQHGEQAKASCEQCRQNFKRLRLMIGAEP